MLPQPLLHAMKNHFETFAVSFHLLIFYLFPVVTTFYSACLCWLCTLLIPAGVVSLPLFLWMFSLLVGLGPCCRAWPSGHSAPYSAEGKSFPAALFLTYEDQTWGTATPRLPRLASWEWGNFPVVQPSKCLWGHRVYTVPVCMHRGDDLKVSCYCSTATKCKLTECKEYYHGNISKQSSLWENITGKGKKSFPPHLEIWMKC